MNRGRGTNDADDAEDSGRWSAVRENERYDEGAYARARDRARARPMPAPQAAGGSGGGAGSSAAGALALGDYSGEWSAEFVRGVTSDSLDSVNWDDEIANDPSLRPSQDPLTLARQRVTLDAIMANRGFGGIQMNRRTRAVDVERALAAVAAETADVSRSAEGSRKRSAPAEAPPAKGRVAPSAVGIDDADIEDEDDDDADDDDTPVYVFEGSRETRSVDRIRETGRMARIPWEIAPAPDAAMTAPPEIDRVLLPYTLLSDAEMAHVRNAHGTLEEVESVLWTRNRGARTSLDAHCTEMARAGATYITSGYSELHGCHYVEHYVAATFYAIGYVRRLASGAAGGAAAAATSTGSVVALHTLSNTEPLEWLSYFYVSDPEVVARHTATAAPTAATAATTTTPASTPAKRPRTGADDGDDGEMM